MTVQIKSRIPALFTLPDEYGAKVISEGQSVYINDTIQNVAALLGNPNPSHLELRLVPANQPGEITPAPSPAHRSASYVPNPSSNWAATAPTTIGDALDRLASKVKLLNAGTPIP